METPRDETEDAVAETAAATAVVLILGFVLWPPGNVYWVGVADVLGAGATLALVATLAVGLGAWVGRTSSIALRHLLAGGFVAYLVGMAAIDVVVSPDGPAHVLWYGLLLVALLGGGLGWRALERVRQSRVSPQ